MSSQGTIIVFTLQSKKTYFIVFNVVMLLFDLNTGKLRPFIKRPHITQAHTDGEIYNTMKCTLPVETHNRWWTNLFENGLKYQQ